MTGLSTLSALTAAIFLAISSSCASACAGKGDDMRHHHKAPAPDLPNACHAGSCCTSGRKSRANNA